VSIALKDEYAKMEIVGAYNHDHLQLKALPFRVGMKVYNLCDSYDDEC